MLIDANRFAVILFPLTAMLFPWRHTALIDRFYGWAVVTLPVPARHYSHCGFCLTNWKQGHIIGFVLWCPVKNWFQKDLALVLPSDQLQDSCCAAIKSINQGSVTSREKHCRQWEEDDGKVICVNQHTQTNSAYVKKIWAKFGRKRMCGWFSAPKRTVIFIRWNGL